ncbi:MAG: Methyltransferase [Arenicellales bacterium IbO2]|nr:MAG: Methyltransferase [Arenicellales bacterium IbO2]
MVNCGQVKEMPGEMQKQARVAPVFRLNERAVVYHGDCIDMLKGMPDRSMQLIVTSPPYNIGKAYEKKTKLADYIALQARVIKECERVLADSGSICWQVGNFVESGAIIPLDAVLYPLFADLNLVMRNRIVWHFEHGLHCSNRFSGRYETISWFTRKTKEYVFNLDPVRVPQKYPGKKYFKGPKTGQYSCNPLGKNPGDLWVVPNVKNNHVEKTEHPCQYPVELIERLVLSMTNEGDWVFDPFVGAGTSVIAAVLHNRRGAGAETEGEYAELAKSRIVEAMNGTLRTRPMSKPVHNPAEKGRKPAAAPRFGAESGVVAQTTLFRQVAR